MSRAPARPGVGVASRTPRLGAHRRRPAAGRPFRGTRGPRLGLRPGPRWVLAVGWVLLVALASATAPPQAAADPPDRWPAGALDVPGRSGIPESQNGPARTAAGGRWAFAYAHRPAPLFAEMVARERSAARQAIEQGRPESLALTAALLLELAGGAHEPMHAALALDAALIALTDPRSRGLLARLDPTRRESLRAALERLDVRDPAGMRTLAESLAGRRLDALAHALHDPADALPRLDAMLAASGWTAPDARRGPAGRQRAQDRPE
ncbi:MAG: hypothetical protein KatS3mg103_0601 [Phycisphaerales bacterium]|nr:MAG: hypothetical protein KatS3mg103_0601 [Phycisphaerales bacterium]